MVLLLSFCNQPGSVRCYRTNSNACNPPYCFADKQNIFYGVEWLAQGMKTGWQTYCCTDCDCLAGHTLAWTTVLVLTPVAERVLSFAE